MARWKIISGARPFHSIKGREVTIGWARDVEKDGVQRTINVCVLTAVEEAEGLPEDSRSAIKSHGRSATNAVLTEDEPPRFIDVTLTGLVPEYVEEEEEGEEEEEDEDWDDEDEDDDDGAGETGSDPETADPAV